MKDHTIINYIHMGVAVILVMLTTVSPIQGQEPYTGAHTARFYQRSLDGVRDFYAYLTEAAVDQSAREAYLDDIRNNLITGNAVFMNNFGEEVPGAQTTSFDDYFLQFCHKYHHELEQATTDPYALELHILRDSLLGMYTINHSDGISVELTFTLAVLNCGDTLFTERTHALVDLPDRNHKNLYQIRQIIPQSEIAPLVQQAQERIDGTTHTNSAFPLKPYLYMVICILTLGVLILVIKYRRASIQKDNQPSSGISTVKPSEVDNIPNILNEIKNGDSSRIECLITTWYHQYGEDNHDKIFENLEECMKKGYFVSVPVAFKERFKVFHHIRNRKRLSDLILLYSRDTADIENSQDWAAL